MQINVTNILNLIKTLIAHSGHNDVARYHYEVCLGHFDKVTGSLTTIEAIQGDFKKRQYKYALSDTFFIGADIRDCLNGEAPTDPPYHDTSLLPKYLYVYGQVGQIIISILKYLIQA